MEYTKPEGVHDRGGPGNAKSFNTQTARVPMGEFTCVVGCGKGEAGALGKLQRCLFLLLPACLPKLTQTWTENGLPLSCSHLSSSHKLEDNLGALTVSLPSTICFHGTTPCSWHPLELAVFSLSPFSQVL